MLLPPLGRRALTAAAASLFVLPLGPPPTQAQPPITLQEAIRAQPPIDEPAILPLQLCGGAYCVAYMIDDQPFRAVVDTGSPFVRVSAANLSTSQSLV